MIKKPVIAFLLDKKGGAIELSYEELNTVDKNGKILIVQDDFYLDATPSNKVSCFVFDSVC